MKWSLVGVVLTCLAASAANGEEMWRAKGPATSFVADWSRADETDAAATAYFLEHVWPRLKPAAESLNGQIKAKTDGAYSGAMSEAEQAAGVVCFPLRVEQVLPWHAVPSPEQVKERKISTYAARGQSQAVCVGVHATADAKGVTVTCGDLTGPAGAGSPQAGKIPASAVTVRLSLAYTVNPRGRGQNVHARQMLLLKVDSWDIPRGRTCEWVVDVHVPPDAAAGEYSGKVKVLAGGKTAAEFDLAVEVMPYELTDNGCRWGAFMTPPPGPASEAWCDLNARYGVNSLAWWKLDEPRLTWTWDGIEHENVPGESVRIPKGFSDKSIDSVAFARDEEFKQFDEGMKRLKKHGFAGPITWFGSGATTPPWEVRVIYHRFGLKYSRANWKLTGTVSPENSNHLWYLANAAVARTFGRAEKEFGWPEVVWCPNDEAMQHYGATHRSAACMIGESMPYIQKYAPEMRMYTVVWHTKADNWKGRWQCGEYQKIARKADGARSDVYGPYGVVCTNCPNDLDRQVTWEAGGEYWTYTMVYSVMPGFGAARFGVGFKGAQHYAAVVYSYADGWAVHNLAAGADAAGSGWIGGEAQTNYYLSKAPQAGGRGTIDHAIASHAQLAFRQGVIDRKYVETLRTWAWRKGSADDIAYVKNIAAEIGKVGGGKGGLDDFVAKVTDESAPDKLRRDIALRIKALAAK